MSADRMKRAREVVVVHGGGTDGNLAWMGAPSRLLHIAFGDGLCNSIDRV